MITVFTPTYNRGYIIHKLYKSLCRQSLTDFEWLVVDDGSTDNTQELIQSFISGEKINLRYFYQENAGKHIAINRGVLEAQGDLFFIVDSDDYLTDDALQILNQHYLTIAENDNFAGISGTRITPNGNRIGGSLPFQQFDCSIVDFVYRHGYSGDMAEAYKTKVLRQFPFPHIDDEKFCPESLVWNRIAQKHKLLYFNQGIYVCEYRPDGLTAKITRVRMQSPVASMLHYAELSKHPVSLWQKIRAGINFWRFAACSAKPYQEKVQMIGWHYIILVPLGLLFHIKDKYSQQ